MSQGQQANGVEAMQREAMRGAGVQTAAARKRAAVELIARHEASLKRTARRFSLDSEDAEDAYQRSLEIVLTKAPTTDPRELIRWTQTVVRHEALAVRQSRERLLGRAPVAEGAPDPIALLPAIADGPDEQAERREEVARGREALRALKPAELRALTLLAEGYSYAEIGAMTGFSRTKVNRVLSEGRARFRGVLASSRDGSRCRELQPLLSAFCDGEASAADAGVMREHLGACASCRSTLRAYRAAPRVVAGLAPLLPPGRSLLGRLHDALANLSSRLPGGGDAAASQAMAAAGSGGAGLAGLAKLLVVCAGAAGGATACVATGVLPAPPGVDFDRTRAPSIERIAPSIVEPRQEEGKATEVTRPAKEIASKPPPTPEAAEPAAQSPEPAPVPVETVEYEAPPPTAPAAPASSESTAPEAGSAAGEFGP